MTSEEERPLTIANCFLALQVIHLDGEKGQWKPFDYQKKTINALFGKKRRKWRFENLPRGSGKSDLAIVSLFIQSQLLPGQPLLYISFTQVNAKDVIWNRMKQMIPHQYVKKNGFKETDLEVHFTNGSVIYLKGSTTDPESLRGVQPAAVVYDEFREHKQEFFDAMAPAMRLPGCWILIISTPPKINEEKKWELYSKTMEMCKANANASYQTITCWEGNPYLQDFYKEEEKRLLAQGKQAEFDQEYMAYFVKGAINPLFPEFDRNSLTPHSDLLKVLTSKPRELVWVSSADTSGWKRWGVLFAAVDKDSRELFILDSIVCKSLEKSVEDREEAGMSGYQLWPKMVRKFSELNPGSTQTDWDKVWDCQDVPIMDDINRWYGRDISFLPVNKNKMSKTEGFGLLRDLKNAGKIWVSDRSEELIDEFQSMTLNSSTGNPKDEYNDLIACARYILNELDWVFAMDKIKGPVLPDGRNPKQKFYDMLLKDKDLENKPKHRLPDGYIRDGWTWI